MDHAGQRYVIVGGTAGMGRAAAELLAGSGAAVAIVGRDPKAAAERAQSLGRETGATFIGEGGDGEALGEAVVRAAERLGGLDGLAVTAGPIHVYGSLCDLDDTAWSEALDSQLMTVVRSARAAIPIMAACGGGAIVTTAAQSIRLQKRTLPHYAAMKSAIASLTKYIAKFHGESGIRANCIAPGAIATEALDAAKAEAALEFGGQPLEALWKIMRRDWGSSAALDRIGEPGEVAELIAFLLSGQAAYLTGALINIDGGSDF